MEKKYRDGLFRNYFSDKKRLLGLCNLLTGEDATDPDEIKINTLDGVFFGKLKNDISCLFRGKFLVIIEHQATINENMPLRILFYVSELLRQYVDEQKKKIYLEKMITLPQPQFFVFYNGRKKEVERREMRLSDAFGGYTCLEVVVQMYNLSAGMNEDLILHDESLNNYCTFLNLYHKFLSEGMDHAHALKAAFDYCISHGIMVEYLLEIKKELASMLALEYDPELERQAWLEEGLEQGIKKGIKKGRKEGRMEERFELVKNLLLAKTPMKYIIAATGWTEEQILKLADNNS
ncbi:MAG: hypothetical protein IKT98_07590 [Selenomonadaceae bacterium]|nr:hypothetical protein [Selenomonadaceae bacterium]